MIKKISGKIKGRLIKKESGSAFILALLFLALGALILAPILGLFSTQLKSLNSGTTRVKELYTADSGAEYALWTIKNQSGTLPTSTNPSITYPALSGINGGTVTYTIAYLGLNHYYVTSTASGLKGTQTTKIEAEVKTSIGGIFAHAVTALNGDISLKGTIDSQSPLINGGDIYANGNINIQGSGQVNGDVSYTGTLTDPPGSITGTTTKLIGPETFPPVDISQYITQAKAGGTINASLYPKNTYTINSSQNLGPIYITGGNLLIKSNVTVTLQGTVFVEGSITLQAGAAITGHYTIVSNYPSNPLTNDKDPALSLYGSPSVTTLDVNSMPLFIALRGTVNMFGSSQVIGIIYAPSGLVTITGSGGVFGAVAGASVNISSGASNVEYPYLLQQKYQNLPGSNFPEIITWKIT